MTTAAEYEQELVDMLNILLEDERASVEMEVALASGATHYTEREALSDMGAEDIAACVALRTEMERAELPVTPQINGVVFEVLGADRYDDRLRAFAHHQRIVGERAAELLQSNLDGELRVALVSINEAHHRHIAWAEQRADAFAATRLIEFAGSPSEHLSPDDTIAITPPPALAVDELMGAQPHQPEDASSVSEEPSDGALMPGLEPLEPILTEPEAASLDAAPEATPEAAPEAESAQEESAPRPRRARTPRKTTEPSE